MAYNPNVPAPDNLVQDDIAAMRDNFQHFAPLAPYIQAILDSRIVEMVSNSNGWYVRWENGLQVCWRQADEGTQSFSQSGALYTVGGTSPQNFLWTYPAAFAQTPIATGSFFRPGTTDRIDGFVSIRTYSAESMLYRYYSVVEGEWTTRSLLMAIGRWK